MTPMQIPVRCGDVIHHIDIDPIKLEALPTEHPVTLERYACLEEIGGVPPNCYLVCKIFNELAAPYRDKPDKFWQLTAQLADFAKARLEDIS